MVESGSLYMISYYIILVTFVINSIENIVLIIILVIEKSKKNKS